MSVVDLSNQALEAKEQGVNEVLKLLQKPDDLNRLHELTGMFSLLWGLAHILSNGLYMTITKRC
jgi:hypothetical protein